MDEEDLISVFKETAFLNGQKRAGSTAGHHLMSALVQKIIHGKTENRDGL